MSSIQVKYVIDDTIEAFYNGIKIHPMTVDEIRRLKISDNGIVEDSGLHIEMEDHIAWYSKKLVPIQELYGLK